MQNTYKTQSRLEHSRSALENELLWRDVVEHTFKIRADHDLEFLRLGHAFSYAHFNRYHFILFSITLVLGTFSTTIAAFVSTADEEMITSEYPLLHLLLTILSVSVTILSGLNQFMKLGAKAEAHENIQLRIRHLQMEIKAELSLPKLNRQPPLYFQRHVSSLHGNILEDSPIIPLHIQRQVWKLMRSESYRIFAHEESLSSSSSSSKKSVKSYHTDPSLNYHSKGLKFMENFEEDISMTGKDLILSGQELDKHQILANLKRHPSDPGF